MAAQDGRLVQECGAGSLPLRVEGEGSQRRIHVEAPEARFEGEFAGLTQGLSAVLGRQIAASPAPTALRNGPVWLFVRFEDASEVTALRPDMSALTKLSRELSISGVAAFYLASHGLLERTGREYVATQATEIGRVGRVHVRVLDANGRSEIGGHAVTVVEGTITV